MLASRSYATRPHLAGTAEDFMSAQVIYRLLQTHLKIQRLNHVPLFPAGSPASRNATLNLTSRNAIASAWIDVYYPVLNTPLDRRLEILGPDGKPIWSAELEEDGDPLDEEAAKYKHAVPAFHGLSSDGDVEGQLVFANFGMKSDYDELVANGVNMTGKIVIVRYGRIFRGLKVRASTKLHCLFKNNRIDQRCSRTRRSGCPDVL
jgi:N-acetylated-alpha-linked acidic dipeptidase